jgi:alpha-L-rhamnosidase
MVKEGATTVWERWEKLGGKSMNSQNHIMFGSVATWFYRHLAGVSCLAPGWERIRVQPGLVPGLDFVTCTLQTMRGEIQVAWERQVDRFTLTVKVPVGAQAEISLPELGANMQIYEGQTLLRGESQTAISSPEIRFLHHTEKWLVYEIGSGFYQFRVASGDQF